MRPPVPVPEWMKQALEGYHWSRATDGESGAAVYRLEKHDELTLYLKYGAGKVADDITAELVRLKWLSSFLSVPDMLQFRSTSQEAWLLTSALAGTNAYDCLMIDPAGRTRTVTALAEFLRSLHLLPVLACPFNSDHEVRMADAQRYLELGQVDESDFNSDHEGWTAEQVWAHMLSLLPLNFNRVVTHGDFSLGNIFLDGGRVTGCLDVGRVGTADPYQDLAIIWHNLAEFGDDLQTHLFRAYGIADPDARRIEFHLCLDEFF
jgi:aminoglycoside 3'-phosphotransferase-1